LREGTTPAKDPFIEDIITLAYYSTPEIGFNGVTGYQFLSIKAIVDEMIPKSHKHLRPEYRRIVDEIGRVVYLPDDKYIEWINKADDESREQNILHTMKSLVRHKSNPLK